MRITGTLRTIGTITTVDNPPWHTDPGYETFSGTVITASDDMLRAAGGLLGATVDIYPHPVDGLNPGECTPENYAHALARLAHAEDHLTREVRSSQAILAKQKEQERLMTAYRVKYHEADRALRRAQVDLIGYKEAIDILAQCTPPDMFVRETPEGWHLTTDTTSTLHASEADALKDAWTIYRAAQAEARAIEDDDDASAGDDDELGRGENGNALA